MKSQARTGAWREEGETLLEILVALVILGVAVATLLSALMTATTSSGQHRKQTEASRIARNAAEALKDRAVGYQDCVSASGYNADLIPATGWTVHTVSVEFWDGNGTAGFLASCPGTDLGVQRITVEATTSGASAQVAVLKRRV